VTEAGAVNEPDANMSASRRLYEEVFGKGNLDAADEIMAAHAVSHGPGSPPMTGTDQIKQQALRLRGSIPDLAVTLNDQFASGDRVCNRWTGSGTFSVEMPMPSGVVAATGKAISFDEIRIDRYAGGKIVESWFIPDRMTLFTAMGMVMAQRASS